MTRYRPRHARRGWWRRATRLPAVLAVVGVLATVSGVVAFAGRGGDERPATRPAAASSALPPDAADGPDAQGDGVAPGAPAVGRPERPDGAAAFAVPAPSPPVGVEIPSIGVTSSLVELGLDEDGAMEAPSDFAVAGWFTPGPQPGQPGPAVVAGHVDSQLGPAVFFRLAELAPGDEVIVHRADGSDVRFTVTGQRRFPKDEFPADAVYGPVPGPELRLITCGGDFDRFSRQYQDNVVVYATGPTYH